MKYYRPLIAAIFAMLILALGLAGCKDRTPHAGKYVSEGMTPEVTLELKATGEGVWSAGNQRVVFRWEVKQDKIWIHAKGGGVMIATPIGDTLSLDTSGDLHPGCPPDSCVLFKRQPEGG
jgi:hypothetical protein